MSEVNQDYKRCRTWCWIGALPFAFVISAMLHYSAGYEWWKAILGFVACLFILGFLFRWLFCAGDNSADVTIADKGIVGGVVGGATAAAATAGSTVTSGVSAVADTAGNVASGAVEATGSAASAVVGGASDLGSAAAGTAKTIVGSAGDTVGNVASGAASVTGKTVAKTAKVAKKTVSKTTSTVKTTTVKAKRATKATGAAAKRTTAVAKKSVSTVKTKAKKAVPAKKTAKVDYDGDGVLEGKNEGAKPKIMKAARKGGADDLKMIKGVGPKMETMLNKMGFYHFDQVAAWNKGEIAWVDANLEGFRGRVSRDGWVKQAKTLAKGGQTAFSKRAKKDNIYK